MIPRSKIRLATANDLKSLFRLENVAFEQDRFREDQIDYFLTHSRASVFVLTQGSFIAGSAYVLWRKSHLAARLYNLAVDPAFQGKKYGFRLLKECELEAARRGCAKMTLEVRKDNEGGIRFYERNGYHVVRNMTDYYEDGMAGLKMSKDLKIRVPGKLQLNIPYYAQTLDFTCGSACLMMALKHFKPLLEFTRVMEMRIWKEATLIFMMSGYSGTSPYGLSLSAVTRNVNCRMIISMDTTPMLRSVRTPKKREVMKIVHSDMKKQAKKLGVSTMVCDYGVEEIMSALFRGTIPIALISTYRLTGDQVPHWVVITGFDKDNIYIHDPDVASYRRNKLRARNLRIKKSEFLRMSRYGKEAYRCLLIVGPAKKKEHKPAPV
ncbi:MAG: GNAT family N-acetyltransferase/peptidase C39 family protein [candidate division Zixibacteria bacterium]|nr:GNAT family N-acetyltransferase/peptidase C39 family protein [candidate division Zixibacteria bacterium]MBU1471051.1 GNAT family N-acetyltransferase/peptidase C39 family protein [candidate division Zixibacteria bacterium]MBU2625087.1 GNAT family N-acetyltransferase/peptidase C39 family protein [candidate division Zixibacteria bacterium]